MKYLIAIVFTLFVASQAREFDRPCRNSQVSPNVVLGFNVPEYLGRWYEVKRYEEANQIDFDCVNANYSVNADGSVKVDNTGYAPGGRFIQFIGNAVVAFPDVSPLPAKLNVTFFENSPQSIYWVLSTDYRNYAVVWSCSDRPNGRSNEQAWVLSRTLTETPAVSLRIDSVLRGNGILVEEMRVTSRDFERCRAGAK